jgi:hypothetical protein
MAPLLGQVGRREVDGDAAGRQRQAGGDQGRAHPLARFRHRLVRQAHHVELGQARRDLDLNVDRPRLDAFERNGGNPLDHGKPPLARRVAEARSSGKNI